MSVRYDLRKDGAIELLAEDMLKRSAQGKTTVVQFVEHGEEIEPEKPKRTPPQNRSMWKWAEMYAEALNDAGYDMVATLREGAEIPWTKHGLIDRCWRPVEEAMYGKSSTKDMTTVECQEISKVISKTISERTGVYVPWPSLENQSRAQQ